MVLAIDVNLWVGQKQFDNFGMAVHGGVVKGCHSQIVGPVDVEVGIVLQQR